jgi:dipeptidyl-peptidase-4
LTFLPFPVIISPGCAARPVRAAIHISCKGSLVNIKSIPSSKSFAVAFHTVALLAVAWLLPAAACAQIKPEVAQLLHRFYDSDEFAPKTFGPARWLENGDAYTTVEPSAAVKDAREIVRYATAAGERSVMVNAAQLTPPGATEPIKIEDYSWSKDMGRLLVFTNTKKVWRANTRGDYWVLDRKTARLKKLGGEGPAATLMFAKFSPEASRVAYVRENNVYVEDLGSGAITQLTRDGSATTINGTTDWVYEEELALRDAFRWSPDGKSIAYWQFDSTGVGIFPLLYNLGEPRQIVTGFPYPGNGKYPTRLDIPYPVTGTANSAVRVGVVNASGGETRWMKVPGDPRDNYIARIEWNPDSAHLLVEQLNRLQNTNDILLADTATGAVSSLFQDRDAAWVDLMESFEWINGGKEFLFESERSGWRHVYRVSRDNGNARAVTHGDFDVIGISGVNEKEGWLYFTASPENATQHYLYRARLDGSGQPERVSPAAAAGWHTYDISPDGRWAFHSFSNFDVPRSTDLVRLPAHGSVRSLVDNADLKAKAAPFVAAAPREFFKVDAGDGVSLDGWMLRPPRFDPSKKYPVLVFVYGEAAGQTVLDSWSEENLAFHRTVAAQGYVVVSFDNRGTPAPKGRAWRKVIYGAIQPVIVKDQTAAIQALLRSRSYLDASRVGVWGWSGGGTSTLSLMFRSPDVYKVGMAVAPVPDLRLYDTIYQERYMGLPVQNVEGYKSSAPINFAEALAGHLLVMHGSGDDNVHYSGTELLLNRLIELGKPIDFMEYPNRTHCICEGKGVSYHVYSTLLRYLEANLPAGPVNP